MSSKPLTAHRSIDLAVPREDDLVDIGPRRCRSAGCCVSRLQAVSGSGIVTGMGTPGTYRVSDGSRVEFAAALAAWTTAAVPVLERVARTYHATMFYKELGDEVQYVTGIHTGVLLDELDRIGPGRRLPDIPPARAADAFRVVRSPRRNGWGRVRSCDPGQLRRAAARRPRHARRHGTAPLLPELRRGPATRRGRPALMRNNRIERYFRRQATGNAGCHSASG